MKPAREIIMKTLSSPKRRIDLALEGYAPLCRMIEAALAEAGYAIVPREPTEAMLEAGEATFTHSYTGTPISTPEDVWAAMVKATQ